MFTITLHDKTTAYEETERGRLASFFLRGAVETEGSESQRYMSVYTDIINGKQDCRDSV